MAMKWTSRAAKSHAERIQQALIGGDWGNIFAPGFEVKEFDYQAMRKSDDDWSRHFSQKQFRENVTNMIKRLAKEHRRSETKAADLGGGGGAGAGAGWGVDKAGEAFGGLGLGSEDPREITFPCTKNQHCTLIVMVPNGQVYRLVEGRDVIVEVVADPTFYDPDAFLSFNQHLDSLEGGAFLSAYAAEGRRYIQDQQDWQYPDRIRWMSVYTIDFDIEQNFIARGRTPAQCTWVSPQGNRFLALNVVERRENQHAFNNNVEFIPPPQQRPNFGFGQQQPWSSQPQPNSGSSTPQHSNMSGFQQQQQPVYQSPPAQQQYTSPPMQQQQQQQQTVYKSLPAQQQYTSPSMQQQQLVYHSPPAQQQYKSLQQQTQVQFHSRTHSVPTQRPHMRSKAPPAVDPNLPTPGVSPAAGMPKNMSMSSSFTEETVKTVYEEENTPKKVPSKQSFLRRVGDIMTGNSSSDGSQSTHMKPSPRKYYGQAQPVTPATEAETGSSSASL